MRLIRQIDIGRETADAMSLVLPRADDTGGGLEIAGSLESLIGLVKSQACKSDSADDERSGSAPVVALFVTRFENGYVADDDAARREDAVSDLLRLVRAAGELGASRVSFPAAIVQAGASGAVTYQDALNRTHDLLIPLAREAEVCGVAVCVQVARFGFLMSPPETRELLDGACSHAVGADVSVFDRCDQADWRDWLTTLGRLARAVGARDEDQVRDVATWLETRNASDVEIVIRAPSVAG